MDSDTINNNILQLEFQTQGDNADERDNMHCTHQSPTNNRVQAHLSERLDIRDLDCVVEMPPQRHSIIIHKNFLICNVHLPFGRAIWNKHFRN